MDIFEIMDNENDILELIEFGIPRKVYERESYFETMDELNFFQRFRLKKTTVLQVLAQIEHRLEFPYDMNNAVSPINQLLTTLRYYATGSHIKTAADFTGMHTSTACRIIQRVSRALASLYPNYIKFPMSNEEIKKAQNGFFEIESFPSVIGTIDGTHVQIQSPGGIDGEIYRNRLKYFSLNVQGICNADLKFTNVVARWPGSAHDATIFNSSTVRHLFERNALTNCWLLGDSAYPTKPYLLTPLANPQTPQEQLYQTSFIKTRNTIERCFGVWKRRFPVMAVGCRCKVENVMPIVVATAVLHNIACEMNEGEPPAPDFDNHEFQNLVRNGQVPHVPYFNENNPRQGFEVRRELINNYFLSLL